MRALTALVLLECGLHATCVLPPLAIIRMRNGSGKAVVAMVRCVTASQEKPPVTYMDIWTLPLRDAATKKLKSVDEIGAVRDVP